MRNQSQVGFVVIGTAIYAAVTLAVVLRHECWRDEADAWLAARDLKLGQLWTWMHYAGTPALWYLMLMPLAKLNFPYISMNLLHWTIAVINAALILSLAPFPKWVRLALVFSYFMMFEYAVVARNYAPLVLFLILIAWIYPWRYQRPVLLGILLALLASTAAHGTIFAAALSIAWGLDALRGHRLGARVLFGGILAAGGVLLAVAQILPGPPDGQLSGAFVVRNPLAIDYLLQRTFTPSYPDTDGTVFTKLRRWPALFAIAWLIPRLLAATLLVGTFWLLRRDPTLLAAFILSFLALLYVFVFKHVGGDRHVGMVWVIIWILFWIFLSDPENATATQKDAAVWKWSVLPIALASIYSTGMAIYYLQLDERQPFSGAKAAAQFLKQSGLTACPLEMFKDDCCESILPYLGRKIVWYAGEERYGTYMLWDRKWYLSERGPMEPGIEHLLQMSARQPDMVLIVSGELSPQDATPFDLVFDNRHQPSIIREDRYAIYVRHGSK